jgi:hypothetical protein
MPENAYAPAAHSAAESRNSKGPARDEQVSEQPSRHEQQRGQQRARETAAAMSNAAIRPGFLEVFSKISFLLVGCVYSYCNR